MAAFIAMRRGLGMTLNERVIEKVSELQSPLKIARLWPERYFAMNRVREDPAAGRGSAMK